MKQLIALILASLFWVTTWSASAAVNLEPDHKGGHLRVRLGAWPKSLNYYTGGDVYNGWMVQHTGLSLLSGSLDDFSDTPFLAEKWETGKDKKTYTYHLNKKATWPNGEKVTAHDVVFSFKLLWDPKRCTLCESTRSYVGAWDYVKAIDDHTFQIKMKSLHYRNLSRVGAVYLLQKSQLKGKDYNKDFNKTLLSGGPYNYDKKASKFRKTVVLRRQKNYWANMYPEFREQHNFDKITMKYIKDTTVAFEAFKRREIDVFYYQIDSYTFLEKKNGAPYTDKRLKLLQASMLNPSGWGGIALNMRSGVTADKSVRKALQYMMNRQMMVTKIYKGRLEPVSGPFMKGFKYSSNSPLVPFDLKKASALLKKAGFSKAGADGYLYREVKNNGKTQKQKASLNIMYSRESHAQWLTVFKEDAKKVGFEIVPRFIDWSAAIKKLDEFKFEGFVISWRGNPYPGPNQLFHGKTAMNKGTSNIPGLNVAKINKLIEVGPALFNEPKRLKVYRELERLIIDEQPYLFRWKDAKHNVAYWSDKLDSTKEPYKKYGGSLNRSPFYLHWRTRK